MEHLRQFFEKAFALMLLFHLLHAFPVA